MLSIKKMGHGSENYYLDLTRYFLKGKRQSQSGVRTGDNHGDLEGPDLLAMSMDDGLPGEPAGYWLGGGCQSLGLSGHVFPEQLKPLMLGFGPATGRPLVQNAGAPNHVPGWDFTFSAPKGVSLAWSQADQELRTAIERAHRRGVSAAIELAERYLAYSRTGKGGVNFVPVKLVVAAFEQGTSRNEDAQLHTHCLKLNLGVDAAGTTRTLYSRPFYVNRDLLGAYYRATLAEDLADLGFNLRKHGKSFEIVGVPEKLIAESSTRRREVLAHMQKHGRSGGAAAAVATLETRRTKKAELPARTELFERWQKRNRRFGFKDVRTIMDPEQPKRRGTLQQAIDAAITRLSAEQSHFTKTDLIEAALQEAPALGLNADAVLRETSAVIEKASILRTVTTSTTMEVKPQDLIDLGEHQRHRRFTTGEVLQEEQELLKTVEALKSEKGAVVPDHIVEMATAAQLADMTKRAKKRGKNLSSPLQASQEQTNVIRHLTKGQGRILMVQGIAGSGKTEIPLGVAKRAWEAAGYKVFAATPTARAREVLVEATGVNAKTVTKLLGDYELPFGYVFKHHVRQLKNAFLGRRTTPVHEPAPAKLGKNSVLILDEGSMLTTKYLLEAAQLVLRSGGILVIAGDRGQLPPPVGRGAPLSSLLQRVGAVELTEIKRQESAWARSVAKLASEGKVPEALEKLAERDAIKTSTTLDKAFQTMIDHWSSLGAAKEPQQAMMLANTNDDCEILNRLAQKRRIAEGQINSSQSITIRDINKERNIDYSNEVFVGDRILITRNNGAMNVQNGLLGTVVAINSITQNIAVKLPSGKLTLIPARAFPHLRLGYAVTNYKSQSDSYRHVLILVTEGGHSLPAFYVQMTRAWDSPTIFTTEALWDPKKQPVGRSPLAEHLSRRPDLRLASDLMDLARQGTTERSSLPPLEINFTLSPPAGALGAAPGHPPLTPEPNAKSEPAVSPPRRSSPAKGKSGSRPKAAGGRAKRPDPLPPIQPPQKRKKKKRERVSGPTEPSAEEQTFEETPEPLTTLKVPPVDEMLSKMLEEEAAEDPEVIVGYLVVPIPQVTQWRPEIPDDDIGPVPLFAGDFLTNWRRPVARRVLSTIKSETRKGRQGSPLSGHAIPAELAANPAYRQRSEEEAAQAVIAEAAQEHNCPPDSIEIVNTRTWPETRGNMTIIWIEVTYRIRTYGPNKLFKAIAIPVPL